MADIGRWRPMGLVRRREPAASGISLALLPGKYTRVDVRRTASQFSSVQSCVLHIAISIPSIHRDARHTCKASHAEGSKVARVCEVLRNGMRHRCSRIMSPSATREPSAGVFAPRRSIHPHALDQMEKRWPYRHPRMRLSDGAADAPRPVPPQMARRPRSSVYPRS